MKTTIATAVLAAILAASSACTGGSTKQESTTPAPAAETAEPLFVRLGGLAGITAVVDEFLRIVMADDRINARVANVDLAHLRQMAIDQLCDATGGGPIVGCKYTGKNMVEAHTGMNITDAEFDAAVEDLGRAMDSSKVPEDVKKELLGGLAGMSGDIVGR